MEPSVMTARTIVPVLSHIHGGMFQIMCFVFIHIEFSCILQPCMVCVHTGWLYVFHRDGTSISVLNMLIRLCICNLFETGKVVRHVQI